MEDFAGLVEWQVIIITKPFQAYHWGDEYVVASGAAADIALASATVTAWITFYTSLSVITI